MSDDEEEDEDGGEGEEESSSPRGMEAVRRFVRDCHRDNPSLPYTEGAFAFVCAGMDYARNQFQRRDEPPRHLTGAEFSNILADFARDNFGPLAAFVLRRYGIRTTRDFGEIVYLLIDGGFFSCTAEDRIEDFDDVYDFETAFRWPQFPTLP